MALSLPSGAPARADSAGRAILAGNTLYADAQYTEAINKYNEALIEQPAAVEPRFNKANSYYRLDDLGEAIDLYQEVAAESKDMTLVAKAKYNLGNCLFQRGTMQRDSDLQKALEDMESSITYWRGVLDIDPDNVKAQENIEVARLTIKDILDQIRQQQEQQQQQGQQDQQQQSQGQSQQQQDQDESSQAQEQDQSGSQDDPNQPPDQNEGQQAQPEPDPNETQPQPQAGSQQDQAQQQVEQAPPDATAQQILDKERQQKQQRQILQRQQTAAVEKDW